MTVEPTIAFDESGNTGANLLDKTQPFFVLASVSYSQEEADSMLSHILTNNVTEAKFSKLKKTSSGQKKILSFLSQPEISKEKIKISFYYKRFLVIIKIIDILVEPLLYFNGIDLYKDKTNILMSNLYYWTMPAFCGDEIFEILLEKFISMIRKKDKSSIEKFYQAAQNAW